MILSYASQRDYDAMAGKPGAADESPWQPEDFAAMGAFMADFNRELEEAGELVETRALDAPVHTRRVGGAAGVVTDGPYAETQEVLAGYWIVECDSFDRATQIALRLGKCPAPPAVAASAYADVRPIVESSSELGF
ncbi:YciI family protein [Dactylosporangium sp. CA-092794]|uniref:YciI family protein n=1 Tax=Dactylosporangium sp. CA-092794 TaxID=3239929 RepID=UPI003D9037DB